MHHDFGYDMAGFSLDIDIGTAITARNIQAVGIALFFVPLSYLTMSTYFTGADVPALLRMALKAPLSKQLLPRTPIRVDEDVVRRIFLKSL